MEGDSVSDRKPAGGKQLVARHRDALRPVDSAHVVITKTRRELVLYSAGSEVCKYRIGLGLRPAGDKMREGDGCTPEGEFYVCNHNTESKYKLSLGLSYPSAEDAARGLAAGLITQEQCDAIVRANAARGIPPWDTPLGGEICIHGGGARRDWTKGCIALDDADICELFELVPDGTPVTIKP